MILKRDVFAEMDTLTTTIEAINNPVVAYQGIAGWSVHDLN